MLLAGDALKLDASMRVKDATHPLRATVTHRLFTLNVNAVTAAPQNAAFTLQLPSITPFAALAGQQLNGGATLKGRIEAA